MNCHYKSLEPGVEEIRLLIIWPSRDPDSWIRCDLMHVNLKDKLPYLALSYVWGRPSTVKTIWIRDTQVSVQPNLFSALRTCRHQYKPIIIWVDALCINQSDISERNSQVAMMKSIYQNAYQVVIWLGEASDNSDLAFLWIGRLKSAFDELKARPHTPISELELFNLIKDTAFDNHWVALRALLYRPYWRRLWVCQELLYAKEAVVLCGSKHMDWQMFSLVVLLLSTLPLTMASETVLTILGVLPKVPAMPLMRVDIRRAEGEVLALYEGLIFGRERLATEPRDYVYAILSIIRDNTITPDYSKSIQDVYTEAVVHSFKIDRSANILTACKLPRIHHSSHVSSSWPSWLPNWTIMVDQAAYLNFTRFGDTQKGYRKFCAGAREFPGFKLEDGGLVIILHGLIVDCLAEDSTTYAMDQDVRKEKSTAAHWNKWRSTPDRKQPYGDELAQKNAFTRTAVVGKLLVEVEDEVQSGDWTSFWEVALGWTGYVSSEADKSGDRERYFDLMARYLNAYDTAPQFFTTERGWMGRGPAELRAGDVVCVLFGADVPFILRPAPNERYFLIGECYLDGIMYGEALKWLETGAASSQTFSIL